jgi:type IV pilus assembly protein PilC
MAEDKTLFQRLLAGEPITVSVKTEEMVVFTRQMATMIGAGISLLETLEILADQSENKGFKNVLTDVVELVRGGSDLSDALTQQPRKIFPEIYCNMVRAAEASGQLDVILDRLAGYQEASAALKREIKSAMTYPVISMCLILLIVVGLMVGIIPKFKAIFEGLGVTLPLPTVVLLAVSDFMINRWYMLIGATFVLIVGFVVYKKTAMGRRHIDWVSLKMPVFGPLFTKVSIARFSRTFATLLSSGVPILAALEIVSKTAGNVVVSAVIDNARENVKEGNDLATPLGIKGSVFPPMVVRMIAIGEKSGALELLLNKIADFYDQQVKATVEALTSLIEPIMIGMMGAVVGGIVLAVFMPIFKLQSELAGGG